ncbi:CyclinC, putative [Acanthamoeba castellanii str. Neff]|uniref:CyclinC, putative n=1 Tax=Acanthamoeba castellanii (strain ATCC 30010 / Neff) TaxID=1257118 RepID=L8H6R3_ACACF|nr:CyclinC, putative [Acanthamoeba castellanii str. Neff]ELR20433.1 CyclinC, putative [Acanthamoeba castellanii str. Neff]
MGKKLHLRQRVVATASIYFRRLYLTYSAPTLNFTMNSFVEYDPRLFAPGCLYLASKIEECMTHAKQFASQANEIMKNNWPYTMNDILESEYFIMEEMNFKMIVYHPYRALTQFTSDAVMSLNFLENAWYLVNDSYRTDVMLMYPPHIVALAAMMMIAHKDGVNLRPWLATLNVDMKEVWVVLETLLDLYIVWNKMSDDEIGSILNKISLKWKEKRNPPSVPLDVKPPALQNIATS